MNISLGAVIIDAAEPEPESAFWHRMLGGSVTRTETHHFLRADGFPVIVVQRAPEQLPPTWPAGGAQQMHVDLTTDDLAAADATALAAGARRLDPTEDVDPAVRKGGRVYASPAGHPFCLRSA
ncbi:MULTISPECIES: VOC family protein [Streptomyces]|uniref:VOC family protein n=1 Tax=Streptomyces lienomycini TaxID=284035 RepID=A0ABV9WMZ8_9ACTN|nr:MULTISPECIES: VOC family protein [Streptomyces]